MQRVGGLGRHVLGLPGAELQRPLDAAVSSPQARAARSSWCAATIITSAGATSNTSATPRHTRGSGLYAWNTSAESTQSQGSWAPGHGCNNPSSIPVYPCANLAWTTKSVPLTNAGELLSKRESGL